MSLQKQSIKYAFTARAFYECLKKYGKNLFSLSDKLYVIEEALINLPELKKATVMTDSYINDTDIPDNKIIAGYIYENWFNIMSPPPFGYNPSILTNELLILGKFQQTDPDNIIVIFNDLQELSVLNRIYSNDELLCVSEIGAYLK